MKRKVNASVEELLRVIELHSDEMTYYLNIETGKVAMHSNLSGGFDEDGNEIEGQDVFANGRYVEISGMHPYEYFQDMERFARRLPDSPLKERLQAALDGRNAMRRFKEVLEEYEQEQQQWVSFRKECMLKRLYDWLEENDLELAQE